MKSLLSIIILLSLSFAATSQLSIRESAKDTVIWQATKLSSVPKIVRFDSDSVSSYTIYYQNAKYSSITDIDYLTTGDIETTKEFYQLLSDVLNTGKEYTVDLDKNQWSISKSMGSVLVWSSTTMFYLNKKQLDNILLKLSSEK